MMPVSFEYPSWLDKDADELKLKSNAPEEVKKAFELWTSTFKQTFVDNIATDNDGFEIDDLI